VSDQRTWLELLLQDANLDALDQHRQDLLDAGYEPGAIDAEAQRAFRLHGHLRDHTQRVAELNALSDMASRLASVRDLDDLLGDIALQARHLLRTDVAYLALVEGDHLRIRFFDGMMGSSIQDLSFSLTDGLAGRIVTTGKAGWTSDYLADPTIVHHAGADQLAGDEQLRSILGVPLHARGETLGVLFAAERRHRPFTDAEVSLLSGLAGHAAVAIANARLFDAERTAAEELRAVNRILDRAIVLHDQLTETVVRGGDAADVVDALSGVLRVPVQLVDAADRPLAGPDLHPPDPSKHVGGSGRRTVILPDGARGHILLIPVIAAEDHLGCLVVRTEEMVDDAEIRLLERGALGIALTLVRDRAVADAATRHRGEILTALIDGDDPATVTRRASTAKIDLTKNWTLAVVDAIDPDCRDVCVDLARRYKGVLTERAGKTVLLVPATGDLRDLAGRATAGLSAVAGGAAGVPDAYAAARRCLHALLALGKRGLVADAGALGVYAFLIAPGGENEAAVFIRRTVGALLDHDAARGTDLAHTLEEYLASGRQHTATADALHIHPNTLYQRLARIGSILGDEWREPDKALDLHVALRLRRLSDAL
jgi:hypothetical protein